MDARLARFTVILSLFFSAGAVHTTPNFVVHAPTDAMARHVGKLAEHYRDELAVEWLGKKLPRWYKPCEVHVKVGRIGAGGATSFAFDRGHVFGWTMRIQGSFERICDSVLPHEVSHTIFASHFRRPLPRWADEGAATLVEHDSEQRRQRRLLEEVIANGNRIPLRKLFAMKEYPPDMRDVLTLYAEGYSLADYLVQRGGKARYLEFLETAHRQGWDKALKQHYALSNIENLETRWDRWVMAGSPPLDIPAGSRLADTDRNSRSVVVRGQNPDEGFSTPIRTGRPKHAVAADDRSRFGAPDPRGKAVSATVATTGAQNEGWVPVPDSRRAWPKTSRNAAKRRDW